MQRGVRMSPNVGARGADGGVWTRQKTQARGAAFFFPSHRREAKDAADAKEDDDAETTALADRADAPPGCPAGDINPRRRLPSG